MQVRLPAFAARLEDAAVLRAITIGNRDGGAASAATLRGISISRSDIRKKRMISEVQSEVSKNATETNGSERTTLSAS